MGKQGVWGRAGVGVQFVHDKPEEETLEMRAQVWGSVGSVRGRERREGNVGRVW